MDRLGGDFDAFDAAGDHGDGYDDHSAHSNPPPSPVGQDERRMQVRAYNHWVSQLGDQNLPNVEDLEPEELSDFGPHSVVLDFSTGTGTPTIQFIGTKLRAECGLFDPIEELHEIPEQSLLNEIAKNYLKVVSAQAPVAFEAESAYVHRKSVAYRGILLPYSSDNETIDFVFAVVNWKDLADAETAGALLGEIDAAMAQQAELPAEEPQVEDVPQETAEIVHFDLNAHKDTASEPEAVPAMDEEAVPTAQSHPWPSDDNVLDMRGEDLIDPSDLGNMPEPNFGQAEDDFVETYAGADFEPAADEPVEESVSEEPFQIPRRKPAVDALGNPVGHAPTDDDSGDEHTGGITTAADYGLPEWDEEEEAEEDVEDVVNPLANIDLNSRLMSLVNSHSRTKKTVELATLSESLMESEEDETEDGERQLFKPKAPSIDTLLTPEEYDEDEDEEVEGYDYDEPIEAADDFAEADFDSPAPEAVFEEVAEFEAPLDEIEEPEALTADPADEEPETVAEFDGEVVLELTDEAHEAVHEEAVEGIPGPEEATVEAELVDESEMAEILEADFDTTVENTGEVMDENAWGDLDDPLELTDDLVIEEAEQPEPACEVEQEVAVAEEVAEVSQEGETAEPDSLTGLLAAVKELSEAARTTQDPGRRALYEAVGKAFDISIKAVLAAEGREDGSVDIAPLDLDEQFEEMKTSALRNAG